ncbi:hypothetical protein DFJ73DRAFT_956569 [Zopfochytrium polystomum]|nr:hypothetical protein DFJ73DRAFT_956569 [Zopfochytrium polystomum]
MPSTSPPSSSSLSSSAAAGAARSTSLFSLLSMLLLVVSVAVFPASWVFAHFYVGNSAGCFSDVCTHTKANKKFSIKKDLALFYSLLFLTALLALLAKHVQPVRRFAAYRLLTHSAVTLGEVAWFALAIFTVLFAGPATNWWNYWQAKEPSVASGKWDWIHAVFEVCAWLSGDAAGMILGLALLPAAKHSAVADALGLPYSATARVHSWLGRAVLFVVLLHSATGLLDESFGGEGSGFLNMMFVPVHDAAGQSPWGVENYKFPMAAWATIALGIVVLTSLEPVRRRAYGVFYSAHFLVAAVVLFAYLHSSISIFFAIPGIALWTIDGLIRLVSRFRSHAVLAYTQEPCGYRTLTVATARAPHCQPGQFLRVAVPAVAAAEFHPWSVVRADSDSVTFLFAAGPTAGNWTARVADHLDSVGTQGSLRLQGPFGRASALPADRALHSLVLYVGGTGVAPALSILQRVLDVRRGAAGAEVHAADGKTGKEKSDTVAAAARAVGLRVYLFWAAPAGGLASLSPLRDLLREAAATDVALTVHLFDTSRPGRDDDGAPDAVDVAVDNAQVEVHASRGRPHLRALLNRHVVDKVLAAQDSGVVGATVGVFVCGPERFMQDALVSVSHFEAEFKQVKVVTEVESYAL